MTTNRFVYSRNDELPGINLPWQEETTAGTFEDLDLSSGHTFTVTLTAQDGTVSTVGTATGYDGGVTIAWGTGALDLAAGTYQLKVVARETATSKDRTWSPGALPTVQIT